MKPFKSLVIVKHPVELVWTTIRDRMPEIVPMLDDVASVRVVERRSDGNGMVQLVNEWRVRVDVPAALSAILPPDQLGWIDRAEWDESTHECHWAIEPFLLPGAIDCTGMTRFEPAIGGRGTRITFAGTLGVDRSRLGGIASSLGVPVSAGLEMIVSTMIPKNFRKTTEALEKWLSTPH